MLAGGWASIAEQSTLVQDSCPLGYGTTCKVAPVDWQACCHGSTLDSISPSIKITTKPLERRPSATILFTASVMAYDVDGAADIQWGDSALIKDANSFLISSVFSEIEVHGCL